MDRPSRIHGLESLRAGAIICLIFYGMQLLLPHDMREVVRFGWMGLDLFLVSSGYLVGRELLEPELHRKPLQIRRFFRGRAFRVLPCYLVVLALYFAVPMWREAPHLLPAWQYLTFTENLFTHGDRLQAFPQAWLLCVEVQSYLVLPFLLLWLLRGPARWKVLTFVAVVLVGGCCARAYAFFHVLRPLGAESLTFGSVYRARIEYPTYTRLDGLTAGVLLALMERLKPGWWVRVRRHGHLLFFAGLLFVLCGGWLLRNHLSEAGMAEALGAVFGFPLLGVGFGLAAMSAMSVNGWLARWTIPGARTFATLSFALYLTHREVVHVVQELLPLGTPWNGSAALVLYHLCCWATAAVLLILVEAPFLRLRDGDGWLRPFFKANTINAEPAV